MIYTGCLVDVDVDVILGVNRVVAGRGAAI